MEQVSVERAGLYLEVSHTDYGEHSYSELTSTRNDEVLLVLHDATMAKAWETKFQHMWNDHQDYTVWKA